MSKSVSGPFLRVIWGINVVNISIICIMRQNLILEFNSSQLTYINIYAIDSLYIYMYLFTLEM